MFYSGNCLISFPGSESLRTWLGENVVPLSLISQTSVVFWVAGIKLNTLLKYFIICGCSKIDKYGGKKTQHDRGHFSGHFSGHSIRCPGIIKTSKVVQQFTYFRLHVWFIIFHVVIVPFFLIGFVFQICWWSKCSLQNIIRIYYFDCINTAVLVRFLSNGCSFFLSRGTSRLFGVCLIVT